MAEVQWRATNVLTKRGANRLPAPQQPCCSGPSRHLLHIVDGKIYQTAAIYILLLRLYIEWKIRVAHFAFAIIAIRVNTVIALLQRGAKA